VAVTADSELASRVAAREWYHVLELAPGVVTPGWYDLRRVVSRVLLPASLDGARCLDIGTFDGFWAFEMERRGAAEVIGIDILDPRAWDWPVAASEQAVEDLERRKEGGAGFEIARAALGSRAERRERSVYDLDPAVDGSFDLVYLGSLLLHLRDPVRALERARSVCRGRLLVVDAIDLPLTLTLPRRPTAYLDGVGRPWWWRPNQAGLVRLVEAAGFRLVEPPRRVFMAPGPGHPRPEGAREVVDYLRSKTGRELLFASRFGAPHAAVLAEPAV
jgi:tRNA (mo5U34)-methyltransferase